MGRFLSTDPLIKKYPELTPYQFASNSPIAFIDLDGLEKALPWYLRENKSGGKPVLTLGLGNLPIAKKADYDDQPFWVKPAIFGNNVVVSAWNGIANTWNDALDGKEGSEMLAESVHSLGDMRGGDFKKVETYENIGGALLTAYFAKKISSGEIKFSAELAPGTKTAGFSFGGGGISKYAFQFGKCVDFVSDFKSQFAKGIEAGGGKIQTFEINMGKNGLIGTAEHQLTNNGFHQFAEVTMGKEVKIFDNFHPNGILKADYIKNVAGYSEGKIISGDQLLKNAKEIK